MNALLVSIFALALTLYSCEGKSECLSVRGHVKCGPQRPGSIGAGSSAPVFIKLVDEDTGGPDDWMDETYASATGAFQVHGCASDGPLGGHIEPMLRIYHKCKGAAKRFTVNIPVEFVNKEYNLTTVYDLKGPLQNEEDHKYPVPPCKTKFHLF